ncbi:MAG: CinA family protein [Bacilli bacterium]|nr:CinA family protein [Bacilli bacterium]MBN2696625.1 CinA family protein [Bacilli bacterium]
MEEKVQEKFRFQESYVLFDISIDDARNLYLDKVADSKNVDVAFSDAEGELIINFIAPNQRSLGKVRKSFQKVFDEHILLGANKQLETGFFEIVSKNKLSVSTAESVTGGMIASRILNQPGASAILEEAYIVYSDEAKRRILGVEAKTLDNHGAVSEATAKSMVEGLAERSKSKILIVTTGFAGPTGGTDTDPVGTVYFGIHVDKDAVVLQKKFSGNRNAIRKQASAYVLSWIIDHLQRKGRQ